MQIVSAHNITRIYRVGEVTLQALRGVSFEVNKGDYIAIMGPSGSGKSTLMNILGCLDTPTSGGYLFEGKDTSRLGDDELAYIRSRRVGFVFQTYNLIPRMNALENVALPLYYQGATNPYKLAREALESVGLIERIHHTPNKLSGGEIQRVAIARAIVTDPALILADEPTGNLDSKSGEQILSIFSRLNSEERTVIIVTHDNDVAAHARKVLYLKDGQIDRIEGS